MALTVRGERGSQLHHVGELLRRRPLVALTAVSEDRNQLVGFLATEPGHKVALTVCRERGSQLRVLHRLPRRVARRRSPFAVGEDRNYAADNDSLKLKKMALTVSGERGSQQPARPGPGQPGAGEWGSLFAVSEDRNLTGLSPILVPRFVWRSRFAASEGRVDRHVGHGGTLARQVT